MQIHELDKRRDSLDAMHNVSDENLGLALAVYLNPLRERGRIAFPPGARYLALAAGAAIAEMTLARELGINFSNVTLVDRDYSEYMQTALREKYPGVQLTSSGLFTYLETSPQTGFSLVTMIGGEYILDQNGALETLVGFLPRIIREKAVVYVDALSPKRKPDIWDRQGFTSLDRRGVAYVFDQ